MLEIRNSRIGCCVVLASVEETGRPRGMRRARRLARLESGPAARSAVPCQAHAAPPARGRQTGLSRPASPLPVTWPSEPTRDSLTDGARDSLTDGGRVNDW